MNVRDTCDVFAIVLQGLLSNKNVLHVLNFRNRDSCGDVANPCERLTTVLRLAREWNLSHAREIGAEARNEN